MKKLFFLISCVFFVVPAYTQFQLSHGTDKNEVGKSVRTIPFAEGYIIGGFTDYKFIAPTDATLLKTKYNGALVWAQVYAGKADDVFNSVRPIKPKSDVGYVCLGTTNSFGYGTNDMLFVRTDPKGNPVSVYTYGGKYGDEGHCIQMIDYGDSIESDLIMIGESASFSSGTKMFIVKTNLNGSFIDGVIIGNKGNQYGYWIEPTSDGGFIAVGASDYACGMNIIPSNLDIFVVKLKYNLNVEWARTIGGGPKLPFKDIAYSVKEIEKGYIITGRTASFGINNTDDAFLLKLDKSGGFLWLRNYGYKMPDGGYDVLNEENTSMNHQYVLTGYTNVDSNNYALLVATDYNGNIAWTRGYGYYGYQYGYEMDRALKPGYIFTGLETSFGAGLRSIYQVVTTDVGDSYCPECEIEPPIKSEYHDPCINEEVYYKHIETGKENKIENKYVEYKTFSCGKKEKSAGDELSYVETDNANQSDLLLYPNPAKRSVRVEYPDHFQYGILKLYNSTGQLMVSKVLLNPGSIEISLDNLTNGMYMVTVTGKDGNSVKSSLLKAE